MAAASTIALLTLSAANTAGTFIGQRKQAKEIERQGDYEAMLFGRNADYADEQARDSIARGREIEHDITRGERTLRGSQRAALASQGLDLDSGSAQHVQDSDATLSEADRRRVRTNAAREALGFSRQADDYRMQGDWTRETARSQAKALRNQSVVTLLTGAADMARTYRSAPKRISRAPTSSSGYGTSAYGGRGMLDR